MMVDSRIEGAQPADVDPILRLLSEQGLPLDGLRDHIDTLLVAREKGRVVGSAALEMYADGALLRSVAVDPSHQQHGLGARLVEAALDIARHKHAPAVYLLTTTAERYFPRFGFEPIERRAVPRTVQASIEFTSACPSTAVVMRKSLSSA